MPDIDTIRKKKELERLKDRKAKADHLGPDVIAKTQATYNQICARIMELEADLVNTGNNIGAGALEVVLSILSGLSDTHMQKWLYANTQHADTINNLQRELVQAIQSNSEQHAADAAEKYLAIAEAAKELAYQPDQVNIFNNMEAATNNGNPFTA